MLFIQAQGAMKISHFVQLIYIKYPVHADLLSPALPVTDTLHSKQTGKRKLGEQAGGQKADDTLPDNKHSFTHFGRGIEQEINRSFHIRQKDRSIGINICWHRNQGRRGCKKTAAMRLKREYRFAKPVWLYVCPNCFNFSYAGITILERILHGLTGQRLDTVIQSQRIRKLITKHQHLSPRTDS